jgi:hypothetical protein
MINDRRRQAALVATMWAACHVRYAAEQALFGLRILGNIKELFNIRRDWLATAGTCNLCLRHSFYFRFTI